MKSGGIKSRGRLVLAVLILAATAASVVWWHLPAEEQTATSKQSAALSPASSVLPPVQAAQETRTLPEPPSGEASADEDLEQIAEKFAAEPALIDALEDEKSPDERTRTEAREVVEASTRDP